MSAIPAVSLLTRGGKNIYLQASWGNMQSCAGRGWVAKGSQRGRFAEDLWMHKRQNQRQRLATSHCNGGRAGWGDICNDWMHTHSELRQESGRAVLFSPCTKPPPFCPPRVACLSASLPNHYESCSGATAALPTGGAEPERVHAKGHPAC